MERYYNVTFYTYSGMPIYLGNDVGVDEARQIVREKIKRAKRLGVPVERLGKGRWEFQTPDDAFAVSDNEGILSVRRVRRATTRYRR